MGHTHDIGQLQDYFYAVIHTASHAALRAEANRRHKAILRVKEKELAKEMAEKRKESRARAEEAKAEEARAAGLAAGEGAAGETMEVDGKDGSGDGDGEEANKAHIGDGAGPLDIDISGGQL